MVDSAMTDDAQQGPRRIDVHHHLMPPKYVAEAGHERLFSVSPPKLRMPLEWTPARSVEEMDRYGIATSITSIATPGVWFGDNAAGRRLARECNEYATRMTEDYPGRFGVFASLPLPDVDGCLREIEYAFDALRADGVVLMTSVQNRWLGDDAFAPVFDELNRRRAVVYVHPVAPDCCRNLIPHVADAVIEFPMDTTRAIVSLLYSGTFARCPEIRFIFSHSGGMLPFVASRVARAPALDPALVDKVPNGAMYELKKLYYEICSATSPMAMAALMQLVAVSQILFGTDYPWRYAGPTAEEFDAYPLSAADRRAINRGSALALFPRFGP